MVTLKEIAKTVGVSTATASRVLNFDQTLSVTAEKRRAIIETAEALNYATPRARQRARQRTIQRVALVHFLPPEQELIDPYYVSLRLGIESRCQALNIQTVKLYRVAHEGPDARVLQGAAGVIAIGCHDEARIAELQRLARHVVFADFAPPGDEFDSVTTDLSSAVDKLLKSLTDLGYRRIGFAGWREQRSDDPFAEVRCRTFIQWMRGFGAFDEQLCVTELSPDRHTEQSGYRLGMQLMRQFPPPELIVTGNDNIAVGVYRAIHELGLRIPDDVAVASFNDISVARYLNPPLTTVRLPSEEIGMTAVDLLAERLAGRELGRRISIANKIVWRGSTSFAEQSIVGSRARRRS